MCILQIGELANAISEEFRETTKEQINWKQIRGMRNWIAHAYGEVDELILWETISNDIPVLLEFCQVILSRDYPQLEQNGQSNRDNR